ncbi:MAG: hypothetical protein A2537_01805 [Candidatus Magasanikbacteria bacterium RIFOXYD2_FULL_36_9]|uniref:Uncharacterized protein n=1 Tax=Candidatus Magasanikbacteria bacterium RIFOXYD2_FULL_36_9 TaxID=1798707 RepID=A0A1F6P079_9BACT|nr:MAG: hypothetical protein A2537_01805 [Candidatus Magasanikbacteria bacterium RIFOXYD2_FULL_36_9]
MRGNEISDWQNATEIFFIKFLFLNSQMTMRNKIAIWLGVVVLALIAIFSAYSWFLGKQARVLSGTARPDFPFSDYSSTQLEAMYPQNPENLAPNIQTPEETHAKFLAALKKEDFDEAVNCCFRVGDRVRMKEGLIKLKETGELKQMVNDLDTKIVKETENSWESTYSFSTINNGKKFGHSINFTKTTGGIWYIKSL